MLLSNAQGKNGWGIISRRLRSTFWSETDNIWLISSLKTIRLKYIMTQVAEPEKLNISNTEIIILTLNRSQLMH